MEQVIPKNEFETLFENFPDGIVIHQVGTIVFINECMKSYLNCSGQDLIGTKVIDLVGSMHVENAKQRLDKLNKNFSLNNPPMEVSFRIFGTDDFFYGECTSMEFNFNGKPSVAVVVRDLSDRKQYEKHLLETDRLTSLGHLAAGVGHEINNPLCFIMLKLDLINQSLRGNVAPAIAKNLTSISDGLVRIQTIVRDLKTLSRQSADDSIQSVDVAKSLAAAISMAKNEIQHRAELVIDIASLQPVMGNEARLSQVFLNLLINSSQAIEAGNAKANSICIKAYNDDERVLIEISDTGTGIPDPIKPNLFKPFFTTKPAGQGTGLGLSICQSIINSFGGRISFVSESGEGTTFTVSFPAAPASATKDPESEMKLNIIANTLQKKVLIIDDDEFLLETLTEVVSNEYLTTSNSDAAKALDYIAAGNDVDVIICDLMMPNMDGVEFYDKLKTLNASLCEKVIFLTGGSFTNRSKEFLSQAGIKHYQKPVHRRELFGIIESIIGKQ